MKLHVHITHPPPKKNIKFFPFNLWIILNTWQHIEASRIKAIATTVECLHKAHIFKQCGSLLYIAPNSFEQTYCHTYLDRVYNKPRFSPRSGYKQWPAIGEACITRKTLVSILLMYLSKKGLQRYEEEVICVH